MRSITLSKNSYGVEACEWIAENIVKSCSNLKKADFSDIFTTRLREELPKSLKFLIDALDNKPVNELILSDNAFGPDGIKSFEKFLEKCASLEILNVSNCGIGPEGCKMLSVALLKNKKCHLKEFYASRDRL